MGSVVGRHDYAHLRRFIFFYQFIREGLTGGSADKGRFMRVSYGFKCYLIKPLHQKMSETLFGEAPEVIGFLVDGPRKRNYEDKETIGL